MTGEKNPEVVPSSTAHKTWHTWLTGYGKWTPTGHISPSLLDKLRAQSVKII